MISPDEFYQLCKESPPSNAMQFLQSATAEQRLAFVTHRDTPQGTRYDSNQTPLFLAASSGHQELADLLILYGADVNAARLDSSRPILVAAQAGHHAVVASLLESGADFRTAMPGGYTAASMATESGHTRVVQLLLDAGADTSSERNGGVSLLLSASLRGHLDIVRMLILRGESPDGQRHSGSSLTMDTPLSGAARYGHTRVVKLLLAMGAAPDLHTPGLESPLFLAATNAHMPVMMLLLAAGADVDSRGSSLRMTPLCNAMRRYKLHVVSILVVAGADPYAPCVYHYDQLTPMQLAQKAIHDPKYVGVMLDRPPSLQALCQFQLDMQQRIRSLKKLREKTLSMQHEFR